MKDAKPLFLVGTVPEAYQVESVGYDAEACGQAGAEQIAALARRLSRERRPTIAALDAEAARTCEGVFRRAGAVLHIADQRAAEEAFKSKDVSTFCDREAAKATDTFQADMAEAMSVQLREAGVYHVVDVALDIATGKADREPIPTGLETLDAFLDGGLPAGGLVTLGAISSTGKTTLALQIADNMAASGRPVLFVTVEQSRYELVAKSLSRLLRLQEGHKGSWHSAGAADIQRAASRAFWGDEKRAAFSRAQATYAQRVAPYMRIMELDRQPTTADIREAAEIVSFQEGRPPVVFVDYLQLLAPAHDRMTERQAIDRNVMDLRHIARDMRTCVVAISSLNRASYGEGVTLESFKESGAIEYGADVLLGLQPRGLGKKLRNVKPDEQRREAREIVDKFKSSTTREAEITILKNRGGAVRPDGIPLAYDARNNLFTCEDMPREGERKRIVI